MILTLLSFALVLLIVIVICLDLGHDIERMDAALRASAYLDRVLPGSGGLHHYKRLPSTTTLLTSQFAVTELRIAPFNPEDVAWLHAAEGRGTYLAEADAVAILMGRATAGEGEG